ncbi:HD domain-containing phosphohydrolase [Larsenimonas rhizosphaerae]|uniref:HD-GYP domain-containing protein n=1 Tax=Larsenimonas rhizosphaerae TaxID=2944682 RepID=A0AA42CY51_9GAMM|nr:HD domain-containing phosphohydrolase [Larsenimonas rhizosphaerae]MCM2132105.1 hypothetical protein [Larsenimonas rhizosphaerae]MCX2524708.1 hypothetical protein [Larsenimonas rhizosphaerae]
MASPDQRSLDIVAPSRIAETLSLLSNTAYDVVLELNDETDHFPVKVVFIDPEHRFFALDITSLGARAAHVVEKRIGFTVTARRAHETVSIYNVVVQREVRKGNHIGVMCDMPDQINIVRERSFFRAQLSAGMHVKIEMKTHEIENDVEEEEADRLIGMLKNLSIGGCLVEMALKDAVTLEVGQQLPQVRAIFPNGDSFDAPCVIRHMRSDTEHMTALLGLQYTVCIQDFERSLWQYVREIERESARRNLDSDDTSSTLWPSPLFQSRSGETEAPPELGARVSKASCNTSMVLKQVTDYLNIQMVDLSNGGMLDYNHLGQCADKLLTLLLEDRQDTLYKVGCLRGQSPLVMHSITVAVRLGDLALYSGIEHQNVRGMISSALVHDLGKTMLPREVQMAKGKLTSAQREALHQHVGLIRQRLGDHEEGAEGVYRDIVCRINERLDGKGYPAGLTADALSEEARMAAVVDVVDAMTRTRADRPAWQVIDVYRYIFQQNEQFDNQWVNRYIKRFGFHPIGSLVRFSNGYLAWILRHDDQGQPSQVKVVYNTRRKMKMDDIIKKPDFPQLGELEGQINPSDYGLTPQ